MSDLVHSRYHLPHLNRVMLKKHLSHFLNYFLKLKIVPQSPEVAVSNPDLQKLDRDAGVGEDQTYR